MSQSAIRGVRAIGTVSGNSRLGSSSSKSLDLTWDVIPKSVSENEVRLINLVREYSAGHEDARLLDGIFELLYDETSPNVMDPDACRSALHWAVLHGQAQLARTLLEAGALANTVAKDGFTPLMVAVRKGSIELVELLLEEGARIDLINTATGLGPLLLACIFANTEMVKLLLGRGATPDVQSAGHNGPVTPLVAAAAKVCEPKPTAELYLQVVEMLLKAGACPDIVVHQEKGETLLNNAVARNQPGLVRALLRSQANPDIPSKDGLTPLMTAVRLSSCELVEMLIAGGAAVEAQNELNGKTAFSMACNLGNLELVQLLLAHGASVSARWFNPNDFNAPILVVACKCDDSWGRINTLSRRASANSIALPEAAGSATGTYGRGGSGRLAPSASGAGSLLPPSARGCGTQVYLDIVRVLLQGGADPNTQGSKNGVTPLLTAVENSHLGLLRVLLEAGANPNLPDTCGTTPLIAACTEGNLEVARVLLEYGAQVNVRRRDGWVALMGAVLNRHTALLELLLGAGAEHSPLVPPGELLAMECTPLMAACGEGSLEVVRLLLSHGADPNQTNTVGQTALWFGCRGGAAEVVRLLLEAGAVLGQQGQNGPSALVQAAYSGSCSCVEMILTAGAELDEYDTNSLADGRVLGGRFTPLAAACSRGCRDTAELLLRRGADPNVTWHLEERTGKVELRPLLAVLSRPWSDDPRGDRECAELVELLLLHGADPAAIRPSNGHIATEIAAREGRAGALQVLLSHGAQSNVVDKDGATPLILAALKGSLACVRLLLAAGANANATTLVGVSPLVAAIGALASGDGNLELIQALLDAGADPNAPFFEEDTVLTAAVDGGNPALVATLLSAGADANQANTAGALPLQLAAGKGYSELVRLLLQAGASPHLPNLDWAALRYHQNGRHDILELLSRAGVMVPPPPPCEMGRSGGRSSSSSGNTSTSGRRLQSHVSRAEGGSASAGEGGAARRCSSQEGGGGDRLSSNIGGSGGGKLRRRSSQGAVGRLSGSNVAAAAAAGGRLSGSGVVVGGAASIRRSSQDGLAALGGAIATGGSRALRPPPLQVSRVDSVGEPPRPDDGSASSAASAADSSPGSGSGPPTVSLLRCPAGGHGRERGLLLQGSLKLTTAGVGPGADGGSGGSSGNGSGVGPSRGLREEGRWGSPTSILARSGRPNPAPLAAAAAATVTAAAAAAATTAAAATFGLLNA